MLKSVLSLALSMALLLAAPPVLASQKGDDGGDRGDGRSGGRSGGRDPLPKIRPVEIDLGEFGLFRPRAMMVLVGARIVEVAETKGTDLEVDWSQGSFFLPTDAPVEVTDENKLDLGKIPLIGGIIKQDTVASRFRDAEVVGDAYKMDDIVVIVPEGRLLPAVWVPRVSTTVVLSDGESFAIGGLLKETSEETRSGLPWLGDTPVLGNLFRFGEARWKKNELLITITPRLIKSD